MQNKQKKLFAAFQAVLLIALISFLAWDYWLTQEFNEIILGVLVGMTVGVPVPEEWRDDKE